MSAEPAYQPSRRTADRIAPPRRRRATPGPPSRGRGDRVAASQQRRRREQRFRQRRRDLLADMVIAFVLAISALIVASGLGVIAIASIPVVLALVGTVILERRARKRRLPARPRSARRRPDTR
jgi:hypothetical protein